MEQRGVIRRTMLLRHDSVGISTLSVMGEEVIDLRRDLKTRQMFGSILKTMMVSQRQVSETDEGQILRISSEVIHRRMRVGMSQ